MLLKAFAVRDGKAEYYMNPFFQKTMGEAERSFRSLVNDEKSIVHQYPEDYDLYFLGEYDDQTGKFSPLEAPQHLQKAVHVKTVVN
ncbi:MAG: nonstructural protein [Arizlama microvirus]|nr:MAG: nonstructural protein [Arizlama microvirus]